MGSEAKRIFQELTGLVLVFLAIFFLLAIFSFNPQDPNFNQTGRAVSNLTGVVGASLAGLLADIFGLGAYFLPALLGYAGLRRLFPLLGICRRHWVGLFGLSLVFLVSLGSDWPGLGLKVGNLSGGGYLGAALYHVSARFLRPVGTYLLVTFLGLVSVQLLLGLSWQTVSSSILAVARIFWSLCSPYLDSLWQRAWIWLFGPGQESAEVDQPLQNPEDHVELDLTHPVKAAKPEAGHRAKHPAKAKPQPFQAAGQPPPMELLSPAPPQAGGPSQDVLQGQAQSLITCLADFGIQGEVQRIVPGPVVTMFEVKPAPGVKISRIAGLSDELALAMKALAVRIEAPIPGKDTVGVEIPNAKRQTVYLREILESKEFADSTSKLTLSIGKDIQGRPQVADLARMPHLLVAGATGSGKSVCINGILLSILYKAQPEEVKLLLIDPKRIELSVYAGLPHLAHPVVTDMVMAKSALEWAVAEMDRRYEAMARLGVRNIDGYNEKLAGFGRDLPEDLQGLEFMPFLILIIDELADLMMTAAKEVEISVVRLAQLARAAGIHLILATQRPSVDVVTGLIKANFPTRISFQVTSRHDSRTILDTVGSERLLGRGDMLYKPSGSKMQRMHGAYVSDEETARVVDYWKDRQAPSYLMDLASWQDEAEEGGAGGLSPAEDSLEDPVYPQALEFVLEQGKASISLIQRRFRIGFNRAARFIEQMEREGLLGPADGSKPRVVLRNRD